MLFSIQQEIMMKKSVLIILSALIVFVVAGKSFSEDETPKEKRSRSVYVDSQDEEESASGGGLLDFLPFIGNHSNKAPKEDLAPSPSRENKPALSEEDLNHLKAVVGHWLITSEITEPAVRKTEDGRYYRNYIVFSEEYRIDVLRGDSSEKPFIANVYVRGDHFKTTAHKTAEEAQADRDFAFQPLEFRVIFEKVEKWDYSSAADEPPFVFREEWQFRKLQSKANIEQANASPEAPKNALLPQESVRDVKPEGTPVLQ